MACSTTPLSCLEPSNIFAGVYNVNCGGFADPSNFQAEKAVVGSNFQELINNYGVQVNYYVNGFNLSAMNGLYGEHPTQEYSGPFVIKSYLELEESVSLTQFGMNSEDELVAYISIKDFTNLFALSSFVFSANGQRIEPKSDDLMEITALGCNRPGNRGAKIFRITEALDQSVQDGLNPMMGHYVWRLKAKRYEQMLRKNLETTRYTTTRLLESCHHCCSRPYQPMKRCMITMQTITVRKTCMTWTTPTTMFTVIIIDKPMTMIGKGCP
jgi:hypothetical protein